MAGCPGTLRKTPKLLPMIHKALNELAYTLQEKGEENGKPLQYSCLENPMNSMKRQKDRTLKDELLRSYMPNRLMEEWRNNSRKNEETEPKQKQHPIVDVTGDRSKV